MNILKWPMNAFDDFIDSYSAQHTTNWPLMISASRMLLVPIGYVLLVTLIGPKFMERRKPYKLKRIIIAYNIFQVISCATLISWTRKGWMYHWNSTAKWLVSGGSYWKLHFLTKVIPLKPTLGCVPLQAVATNDLDGIARVCWWTMLLKLAELVETIFFILRKKQNQVSALHVYHHASTLIIVWGATKLFPSAMVLMPILLNSLVHFLMYTYYLFSSVGPRVQQKIAKWKKYVTIVQMIQFCILLAFTAQIFLPYCQVPNIFAFIFIPNVFLVFYLFYQFYEQAYSNRAQKTM